MVVFSITGIHKERRTIRPVPGRVPAEKGEGICFRGIGKSPKKGTPSGAQSG